MTRFGISCDGFFPEQASRVHYYDKEESLFDHMGIEMEISRAINRKVWLKSGGHIVVDHTEAMTVIDVNTGRFVGKKDQEETILQEQSRGGQGDCLSD